MTKRNPGQMITGLGVRARAAALALTEAWEEYGKAAGDPPSWETFAWSLEALDRLKTAAREVRDGIEAEAAPLIPRVATAVPDVGLVEKHGSGKRVEWNVPDLQAQVAKILGGRLADDREVQFDEDGELLPRSEMIRRAVARAVEATVDACGMTKSKDWRAGSLTALGIDPKEFKASEFSGWKVRITPGIIDTTTEGEPDGGMD